MSVAKQPLFLNPFTPPPLPPRPSCSNSSHGKLKPRAASCPLREPDILADFTPDTRLLSKNNNTLPATLRMVSSPATGSIRNHASDKDVLDGNWNGIEANSISVVTDLTPTTKLSTDSCPHNNADDSLSPLPTNQNSRHAGHTPSSSNKKRRGSLGSQQKRSRSRSPTLLASISACNVVQPRPLFPVPRTEEEVEQLFASSDSTSALLLIDLTGSASCIQHASSVAKSRRANKSLAKRHQHWASKGQGAGPTSEFATSPADPLRHQCSCVLGQIDLLCASGASCVLQTGSSREPEPTEDHVCTCRLKAPPGSLPSSPAHFCLLDHPSGPSVSQRTTSERPSSAASRCCRNCRPKTPPARLLTHEHCLLLQRNQYYSSTDGPSLATAESDGEMENQPDIITSHNCQLDRSTDSRTGASPGPVCTSSIHRPGQSWRDKLSRKLSRLFHHQHSSHSHGGAALVSAGAARARSTPSTPTSQLGMFISPVSGSSNQRTAHPSGVERLADLEGPHDTSPLHLRARKSADESGSRGRRSKEKSKREQGNRRPRSLSKLRRRLMVSFGRSGSSASSGSDNVVATPSALRRSAEPSISTPSSSQSEVQTPESPMPAPITPGHRRMRSQSSGAEMRSLEEPPPRPPRPPSRLPAARSINVSCVPDGAASVSGTAVESPCSSTGSSVSSSAVAALAGTDSAEMRSTFQENMKRLKRMGWYWGPLTVEEAELLLSNKKNGTFLVRDSAHDSYILSISFRADDKTYHTRIEHTGGKFSFMAHPESYGATSIDEFILRAVEQSARGRVHYFHTTSAPGDNHVRVALLHPLSRFLVVQSLMHMCRFEILTRARRDHIDQLPLPTVMKNYLREKQYFAEYIKEYADLDQGGPPGSGEQRR